MDLHKRNEPIPLSETDHYRKRLINHLTIQRQKAKFGTEQNGLS